MPRTGLDLWRFVVNGNAAEAADGEGARRHGGRWYRSGIPAVCAATTPSLAVLEALVHVEHSHELAVYHLYRLRLPEEEGLVEEADLAALPAGWDCADPPAEVQSWGERWLRSGRALALVVPSAVVPYERNVILNPRHAAFRHVVVEGPQPWRFDERLLQKTW